MSTSADGDASPQTGEERTPEAGGEEERQKNAPRNFNMCLFTEEGTPLPLSDEETLVYFAEDVKFYIKVGKGGLINTARYFSKRGAIFMTNCRLMYIPSVISTSFCSFSVPLTSVADVTAVGGSKVEMVIVFNGNVHAVMKLDLRSNLVDTFTKQLQRLQESIA